MSCGDVHHSGNSLSGLRKTDVHWKLKHRSDCPLLFGLWNITKWTREVAAGARPQLLCTLGSTNTSSCGSLRHCGRSQRATPQSKGDRRLRHSLLVDKVRIIDLLKARLVALAEDSPEFCLGLIDSARQYQCRISQIDEGHFAPLLDSPPMPQFSREAGLASMRNFCLNHLAGHACIVSERSLTRRALHEPALKLGDGNVRSQPGRAVVTDSLPSSR